MLIIAETPYRISFVGGGTDFKEFYSKHGGAVLSTAIDKHIYHIVSGREYPGVRVGHYEATEEVSKVDEIKHNLLRECLKSTGITTNVQVDAQAPLRAGIGLGSSSSYCVGLLNALYAYKRERVSPERLGREAYEIEREILKEAGGKQDQYIAAYGGFRLIEFETDENVRVEYANFGDLRNLRKNLMLFDTGITRKSSSISCEQKNQIASKTDMLLKMKELVYDARDSIKSNDFEEFGRILHKNWEIKKRLANGITNPPIENYYDLAMKAGAIGGKLLGAGGGGYLLFFVPEEYHADVRAALKDLVETDFDFEPKGSNITTIPTRY
jgi:D-glycero-alpha-D-manno-heptose-7-phosphate kinase